MAVSILYLECRNGSVKEREALEGLRGYKAHSTPAPLPPGNDIPPPHLRLLLLLPPWSSVLAPVDNELT
ncbi:hypothetical protein E2C01_092864 [Portunus trituberculatus]|uniref:Uncharacterized protein n=1 Tax=Portunus trituberculatus TaxID=210409 RepID=A0A5B7JSJ4_PORTR|nr:hypothetical protein [Portunus trituberculatus]